MPTQQPTSLQDIIAQRQEEDFVGRKEFLRRFRENLRLPLDDSQRRFVFNVFGQAGVGKTWLLHAMQRLAAEEGHLTAWADETQQDIPAVMGVIAAQLDAQGISLKSFNERYRAYRQQRQELEADPEAPQGLPVFLGHVLARVGIHLMKQVPIGGALVDFLDDDAIAEQVGEWTAYITRKITNKDEVHLVMDPIAVLTPLFLEDLRKRTKDRQVVLFFDDFEQTATFLDPWLRSLLQGKHGEVPARVLFVIAGREALDRKLWAPYERVLVRMPLAPFTDEELREYLQHKGITDERIVSLISRVTGNLPLLVATLTADGVIDVEDIGLSTETAVDVFLRGAPDAQHRNVALNLALPRRFNRDIFRVLVHAESEEALFTWLIQRPFVQETPRGWTYHGLVRTQLLRYKHRESPDEWTTLHDQLAQYFEEHRDQVNVGKRERIRHPAWQQYALEAMYHRLCQNAEEALADALNGFMEALAAHSSLALQWAETIHQAGEDAEESAVREWGQSLVTALQGEKDTRHTEAVAVFTRLLESPFLKRKWRRVAYEYRGEAYAALEQYDAALADFTRALRQTPDDPTLLVHRGETYLRAGKPGKALADLNRALEHDPHHVQARYLRGVAHLRLRHYRAALTDLNAVLEAQPDHLRALTARGDVHQATGEYDAALEDYNRALDLSPGDPDILARRGELYLKMGRAREALSDLSRSLSRRPHDARVRALRGEAYRLLGYYPAALADLNRAIDADPTNAWALASRGELYRNMGQYERALADLTRALDLNPNDVWARTCRGITYLHLDKPRAALNDLNRVLKRTPDDPWALAHRAEAYRRLRQLSNAIRDITKAIRLAPNEDWYLYGRALVYLSYSRRKLAKAHRDLRAAIAIAEERYRQRPEDWANTLNLALYYLALGEEERAEALYREALSKGATPYHIRAALDDVRILAATISDLIQTENIQRMQQERLGSLQKKQAPHQPPSTPALP